jgi:hypothetical protein
MPAALRRPSLRPRRGVFSLTLAFVLLLGALGQAGVVEATGGNQFVAAANAYRQQVGVSPVAFSSVVDTIAVARANKMARADVLAHDLDYVMSRLNASGICWSSVGEIIAWERGYPTLSYERVVDSWWKSPDHKAILIGPSYDAASGSWATSADGAHYSVMIFVALCGATDTAAPTAALQRVVFRAGRHTGYRFSSSGAVLGSRSYDLSRTSGADTSERRRINGTFYLRITDGIWAGYWVPETARSYIPGFVGRISYQPMRRLTFASGTYTAYRYDGNGRITASRRARLYRSSGASATGAAWINGRPHFLIADGIWGGYWMPYVYGMKLSY